MAPKTGVKRASPGADEAKNPLANVELGDEDAQKLAKVQRDLGRLELAMDRLNQAKITPIYEKRREITKSIEKFWPVALMNHSHFGIYAQHNADQDALSYLEDLWVARDPVEPRCYTIEFYFKENPYFTNTVLKKEFKYNAPPSAADEKPDEDGITESMLDFSWERDVEAQIFKIDWKDAEHTLTKLHPSQTARMMTKTASWTWEIGITIANEVFPDAIEFFLGEAGGDEDLDSDDEDDDEAEEIDLEKPRSKKQKV
ncbi:hypothetical protein K438DRAFT_1804026 [Mycena galopus ATCC 62051]|nr:hypothetical protein K438DRAFT_1804026 [Mycena galopus ATCC 62051]